MKALLNFITSGVGAWVSVAVLVSLCALGIIVLVAMLYTSWENERSSDDLK